MPARSESVPLTLSDLETPVRGINHKCVARFVSDSGVSCYNYSVTMKTKKLKVKVPGPLNVEILVGCSHLEFSMPTISVFDYLPA